MNIYTVLLILNLLLLSSQGWAQSSNKQNPFFNEPGFFTSEFENKLFITTPEKTINHNGYYLVFAPDPDVKHERLKNEIEVFCKKLENKKFKNEMTYLRHIFIEIHRQYLKKYQRYSTFERVLTDGSYDCLTGTVLYAMVLEQLGFPYEIHETRNHCYLKTYANLTPVLFESTDVLGGFVTSPDQIEELEKKYSMAIPQHLKSIAGLTGNTEKDKDNAEGQETFNAVIGLQEAAGLHYYNQSVIHYNIKDFKSAVRMLEKSYHVYPCKRVLNLLLTSIDLVTLNYELTTFENKLYLGKKNYYTQKLNAFHG